MEDGRRWLPGGWSTLLGSLLLLAGVGFLGYAAGIYFELLPGSRVTVPKPVALEQPRPTPDATATPIPPTRTPAPTATMRPAPTRSVAVAGPKPTMRPLTGAMLAPPDPSVFDTPMVPADAEDRPYRGNRPRPGIPIKLAIPAIDMTTDVSAGGIILNKRGEAEWETLPFVAVHYRETGLVGARGNAVISGHVVTLYEGNVFRDLYKLNFGDAVQVDTEEGRFTYVVEDVKLVKPDSIEVMAPSTLPILTLITCGGEFDTRSRSFSDRLIVVARLADWEKHATS